MNIGSVISHGMRGISLYNDVKRGESLAKSAIKMGASYLIDNTVSAFLGPGAQLMKWTNNIEAGFQLATANGRANAAQMSNFTSYGMNVGNGNANVSQYALAARERALNAAGSHANMVRSALGNEARRRSMVVKY